MQKFGKQLGFLTDNSTFRQQGDARKTVTTLLPMGLSSSTEPSVSIYNTHSSGFMGEAPKSSFFASSVHDSIINQLLLLTLTPIYGRDILLRIDLIERLVKTGAKIADSVRGSREIVLPGGNPAILFDKSLNPDVEMEVDGQKVMVPLYNPYLLTDTLSRVINKIQAEKLIAIKTLGNIKLAPGEMNLESEDLSLKAQKQIEIAAEFQYSPYGRVGVDPVVIEQRGKFEAEGKEGVFSRGANITAKSIKLRSSEGNVVDSEMPLDMNYKFSWGSVTGEQKTISSVFTGNGIEFSAPNGTVEQHGTDLIAGEKGVMFEGKYDWQPAYQKSFYATSNRKGMTTSETQVPKPGGIQSTGGIIFKSKDATLAGATIVTSKISYPEDGDLTFNPAYVEQKNHSVTIKNGLFGSSKAEFVQDRSIPVGAKILADKFEALGMGKLEMVDVTGQILDAVIEKTLIERAAYETNHTVITQHSSGFFAPKINGDVFINALENANKVVTFGDALPTAFNVVGSGVKTLAHAEMMSNLSKMENPMLTLSKIFLGRFVTGFGYSNIKTTIKIDEKRPHQSQMKIGLLRISNDRTHLEGIWDIEGKGTIKTGKFTTQAPKHEVKQEVKTSGYSITFSPDSFLTACFSPQAMVGAMPNVSVIEMESRSQLSENIAQVINADDLFVRCDDAVFSGSQIRARLIDAIVTNDLTIEDLRNEFRSESHDQSIGVELSGIASMIHNVDLGIGFGDPRLKAIPRIRFAEEHELSRRVQHLASLVGTEKFYLTVGKLLYKKSAEVGLRPDGVVVKSDAEKISAGKILEEKLSETQEHDRRVVNPCVAEFISMMSEVNELQQLRQQISRATYNQAMNEGLTDADAREIQKDTNAAVEVVAETEQKISTNRKAVLKAMRNKAAKKSPALRAQVSSMSDEEFSYFVQNYVQSHDDDLSNELVDQAILSEIEERAAYQEAAHRLEAMSFGDKVKEYVGYIVDELNRPSPEFVEAMSSADSKKIREYAAKKNLKLTSGILDFLVPFDASAVDEHVQGKISVSEDAQRQGVAVTETAVAGLIFGKIAKAKCVTKFVAKIQNLKHGVIAKLAKGINPTKYKGDISATKIGLKWGDPVLGEQGYGMAFENYVATLPEFKNSRLPKNFKTFDFWFERNGRAVSVKTIDTNAPSRLMHPESVYQTLKGYVDKTLDFKRYDKGLRPDEINTSMIKIKEIQLGIPADTGIDQMRQIQRAIEYGKLNNVKIEVTRIGK